MKITYIQHSGFSVELPCRTLLFDYYMGDLPAFPKDKPLFVFASHKHADHFDLDIFKLSEEYENVTYVLSSDIKLSESYLERRGVDPSVKRQIVSAAKNTVFHVDDMEVSTLKSTDEGVAFALSCEGKSIYHAGDLNWWFWAEESAAFNLAQEKDYKREIDSLKGRRFDAAFVPVDPRLSEAGYAKGIDYFMAHTDTAAVFPMHFWRKHETVKKLRDRHESVFYRDRIMEIEREGQVFIL